MLRGILLLLLLLSPSRFLQHQLDLQSRTLMMATFHRIPTWHYVRAIHHPVHAPMNLDVSLPGENALFQTPAAQFNDSQ